MKSSLVYLGRALGLCAVSAAGLVQAADTPVSMDPRATPIPFDQSFAFSGDPVYTHGYDFQRQLDIYGAKHANPTARPLLELGRELYGPGQFQEGINLFGEKNLVFPQVLLYGDLRMVAASNDNGANQADVLATKLTLDLDVKITATERIHAVFTPLDRDGKTTRVSSLNGKRDDEAIFDMEPDALFFEGDLARIVSGATGKDNGYDIPFTAGLIPLLFQNGVWMQDAITGFAFTIPARNSPALQISNMDITFFAGFDRVTTAAIPGDHRSAVYGFNTFIEAMHGYWEIGYGYVADQEQGGAFSYHNASAAFTRRYWERISNSIRVIANFGQDPGSGLQQTADGYLFLIENSLISSKPLTLVPYFNAWFGVDKPQSLARAAGAGGVLLNTGINFETDGITGFPKMDDTANETYGAALGIEYLFDLTQQIVFEVAALDGYSDRGPAAPKDPEFGFGIRYQRRLNHAWIFRTDAIAVARENADDLAGVRMELRRKF
jgi:hypothetical protein